MEANKVACRCDRTNFISPHWTNPKQGEIRHIDEDKAAFLASLGHVTILKVEAPPEKKPGSAAQAGQASKPKTSRSSGKKSTKRS